MKTHKFARKPFYVDAVRVSSANMKEVAEWCNGEIITDSDDVSHIKVKVFNAIKDRQTQAFVGDWVLFAGKGFKVFTPKAFDTSFEKVKTLTKAQADEAGIKVPHEPRPPKKRPVPTPPPANPVLSKEVAGKIEVAEGRTETDVPKPEKDEADKLIEEVLRG